MAKILLIGVSSIKSQSVIENNVDDKELSKVIHNVQEIQLKPILGQELYEQVSNEVKSKIEDSSYDIPELYSTLINEYIKPFLIYATVAEFLVINSYKISNKGVQKLNDNSSTSINADEIEYLKNYYDNFITTHKSNLIKFLKEQNILPSNADTDTTSYGIGWHLESDGCNRYVTHSSSQLPSLNETDPIWLGEKNNYYTKVEIDSMIGGIGAPVISVNSKTGAVVITKSDVGLSNVDNTTDLLKPISTATQYALDLKADLIDGKVPAWQLPAYVDDVLEFDVVGSFPVSGESGKIYIAANTNLTYRWTGTTYAIISQSLALGETSSTAYRGDRGKAAYDHITVTGNPHNTSLLEVVSIGNYSDRDLNINSVYIGTGSLFDSTVVLGQNLSDVKSTGSVLIGYEAGIESNNNVRNVMIGFEAGRNNASGNYNTGIGYNALKLSTASQLSGFGYESLMNATGSYNAGFGYRTLKALTSGEFNVAVGTNAMANQTTANNNVAIGYGALWAGGAFGSETEDSVAIGFSALRYNGLSSKNVAIGKQAGETQNGGGNVLIGFQAGKNHEGQNCLFIANTDTSNPLIYGEFDNSLLIVNGSLTVTSLSDAGIVIADNNGLLSTIPYTSWTDISDSSTIVGFSNYNTKFIRYAIHGKAVYVQWDIYSQANGGSGSNTSFTLPFNVSTFGSYQYGMYHSQNTTTQGSSLFRIAANSNVIEFSTNASNSNFNAWTDAATRGTQGFAVLSIN